MAELVGLTASVIGTAGLATKVVTTSVKVKGLLEQVNKIPEELQQHLDQIELFSPLLTSQISDDGPSAMRGALDVAMIRCQQAADDLGKVAEDLLAQVNKGGKAGRKIRAARVILQKDVLASNVKRLSSAMQMLMMASQMYGLEQQRYLINLQKGQPGVIVSQVLAGLQETRPEPADYTLLHDPVRKYVPSATSENRAMRRRNALWAQRFQTHLRLGLGGLTGSLEVQYGSKGMHQDGDKEPQDLRLRVHLPRWFSSKSLDYIVRRSQAGWDHHFHTATLHPEHSTTSNLVMELMENKTDSVRKLQYLIAEGRVSVFDSIYVPIAGGCTMMEIGLRFGNWQICDFLAGYDVPISRFFYHYTPWFEREKQLQYIQSVASCYADTVIFFWVLFQEYEGPIARFDAIRRLVWPDFEFYDVSFFGKRLLLASAFADVYSSGGMVSGQSFIVRALLSRSGEIYLPQIGPLLRDYSTPSNTIHRLRGLLVSLSIQSLRNTRDIEANSWAQLMEDLLRYIMEDLYFTTPGDEPSSTANSSRSVHSCLFEISVLAHTSEENGLVIYTTFTARRAEASVGSIFRQYLAILHRCGVDIGEYGRFVEAKLKTQRSHFLSIFSYRERYKVPVEVKGVRTGATPNDWEIWFGERTDEYAGEFWHLVDPAPLYVPGAWVEEE
ncbi:hypothetical protein PG996_008858 [Apiospora saccharicola]|uniref:NACHT-NTPase and P-loop NTPases N-terminal domain-containing protein n=1 Tax=Apiospora saccharicola TaxID=335842 RepID=A0ABR1V1N9_9PEZI